MASIYIHLFGKPAWEIDLERELSKDFSEAILVKGDELQKRLKDISEHTKILFDNGWKCYGMLYDVEFYKKISIDDAKKELEDLGLKILIENLEEDFEEEE